MAGPYSLIFSLNKINHKVQRQITLFAYVRNDYSHKKICPSCFKIPIKILQLESQRSPLSVENSVENTEIVIIIFFMFK